MGQLPSLIADRGDDFRMRVTVDICPDRAVPVEVFAAFGIDKKTAASFDQHERIVLRRAPVLHLRERVPNVPFVGLAELVDGHGPPA